MNFREDGKKKKKKREKKEGNFFGVFGWEEMKKKWRILGVFTPGRKLGRKLDQ